MYGEIQDTGALSKCHARRDYNAKVDINPMVMSEKNNEINYFVLCHEANQMVSAKITKQLSSDFKDVLLQQ